MKYCPKCGQEGNDVFCIHCGTKLEEVVIKENCAEEKKTIQETISKVVPSSDNRKMAIEQILSIVALVCSVILTLIGVAKLDEVYLNSSMASSFFIMSSGLLITSVLLQILYTIKSK